MVSLRSEYLLDPEVVFLNHGSFGACPKVVFKAYQNWQRELERNPVVFLQQRLPGLLLDARGKLAAYLGADVNEIVYLTNPTTAINLVARSLDLKPGDEILATTHEYPAMENTWGYIAHRSGARYIHQMTPLPLTSAEKFVESFWAGVNGNTHVIFMSHIIASLAIILPVQEICRRAREAGIITIIDGAHAPSQIPLNLSEIGADIYFGACHKWLSAPKGSGFLYARAEAQTWLEPLVISIDWVNEKPLPPRDETDGLPWLVALNQWQGTRDPSAFLSVPAAIEFQQTREWDKQRQRCHELAAETRRKINAMTGLPAICPDSSVFFEQMVSIRLPSTDPAALSRRLQEEFRIIVPVMPYLDGSLTRVSFQAYNDEQDAERLIDALKAIL